MGVDWVVDVKIYSQNTQELDDIISNFSKYFEELSLEYSKIYKISNCIVISIGWHRGRSAFNFDYKALLQNHPSCYIEEVQYADYGYFIEYFYYVKEGIIEEKGIGYDTLPDGYHYHNGHLKMIDYEITSKSKDYIKQTYRVEDVKKQKYYILSLRVIGCNAKNVLDMLESEEPYIRDCIQTDRKGENYTSERTIDFEIFYPSLMTDTFEKIVQKEECHLQVHWKSEDGKRAGIWAGSHHNDEIKIKSLEYATNPHSISEFEWKSRQLINDILKEQFKSSNY